MKETQKALIENYIKSYNNFDIDGMTKDLDEKIIFENISNGKTDLKTENLIEFKNQANSSKQYFSKREQKIKSWSFNKNSVIINIEYEGILAVDFPNGMKKGDTLKLEGQSEFKFNGNKIIEIKDKS